MLRPRPESLQYGGDVFCAASSLLSRAVPGAYAGERGERACALPVEIAATALLLARLPTLDLRLSDSAPGERMRRHFDDRIWGVLHSRLAQGVLVLPSEHGDYLRGRSRQALRTNTRRARAAGLVCRQLDHLEQRRAATLHLRTRVGDMLRWADELFCLPGDAWLAAQAPSGEAVALAQVTVDREWALLHSLASVDHGARYLLHCEIVRTLIAANVRYLAVSAPMAPLLEPSLQYWQRLLGFGVFNLSLRAPALAPSTPAPSLRRAILVSGRRPAPPPQEAARPPVGVARS